MKTFRFEIVSTEALVSVLEAVSLEGWTLVSTHLHVGGTEPVFYVLWDKLA